jgi:VanZ family protein
MPFGNRIPAMNDATPLPPDRSILWRLLLAGYWLTLLVATHLPVRVAGLPRNQADKLVHFVAYAILAWLLSTAWQASVGRLNARHLKFVWLAVVLYGAVDEITQPLVGRTASVIDWLSDAAGAALGLVIFQLIRRTLESK